MRQRQLEFDYVMHRINLSMKQLWQMSYKEAKLKMPKCIEGETMEQYYRDLGISTLFEFAENVRLKAVERTKWAMEEDYNGKKEDRKDRL